jgi:ribosome-binding protein aMBF1 (putative translation factor)
MPAPIDGPHARRMTSPFRCDFCGREVTGAIRLIHTWAGIQYRWCEDCALPVNPPIELFLEPPISPN